MFFTSINVFCFSRSILPSFRYCCKNALLESVFFYACLMYAISWFIFFSIVLYSSLILIVYDVFWWIKIIIIFSLTISIAGINPVNVTLSGRPCQRWDSQSPHLHPYFSHAFENYCMNPDEDAASWCYTTDVGRRTELCPPEVSDGKSLFAFTSLR